MGGHSSSTVQPNGSNLSQMFAQNPGYQQTPLQPRIAAPQYPAALSPSVEQAQAATVARMLARTPVAPAKAPRPQQQILHYGHASGDPIYYTPPGKA
jgi:hypothetical protein